MNDSWIYLLVILLTAIAIAVIIYYMLNGDDQDNKAYWVAVGQGEGSGSTVSFTNIVWSNDGKNFKSTTMVDGTKPFGSNNILSQGNGIAYDGKGRWVAAGNDFGNNTSNILWSNNGKSWNKSLMIDGSTKPFGNHDGSSEDFGTGVAYGDGLWVATGYAQDLSTNSILWSDDGKLWNNASMQNGTSPFSQTGLGNKVAYNGSNLWVAVGDDIGNNTSNILWSDDGKSWNTASMQDGTSPFGSASGDKGKAVAYGNNKWVAVGNQSGADTGHILWSNNGKIWNTASMQDGTSAFSSGDCNTVAYGNNIWVAGGQDQESIHSNIVWSNDGEIWYNGSDQNGISPYSNSGKCKGLAYGKNSWRAVGLDNSGISSNYFSSDGKTWNYTGFTGIYTKTSGEDIAYRRALP